MNVPEAIETLVNALETDLDYRRTWRANIAMCFYDTWPCEQDKQQVLLMANEAAERFLKVLCRSSK